MFAPVLDSILLLLEPSNLMWCVFGVALGVLVGAIPGLGGGMLMALMLPLTFAMDNLAAQIFLIGIYVGGVSGGLVSGVLIGVPGAPSAVMTTIDGHAMCKKGLAGRALSLGISASFAGGVISWLLLVLLAIPLASVATSFQNFDYFAFVILGLVLIAVVGSEAPAKALLAGFLGIFVSTVGFDAISASNRFTFDVPALANGFHILPVLIGTFAVRQVLADISSGNPMTAQGTAAMREVLRDVGRIARYPFNVLRSSILGTWIGLLPGIGANIGAVLSYSMAQTFSKKKEEFGHGSEEAIVAAESGNNATVGGALIPMIALGIPGSGQDVLLMAALILHAVEPGPLLVIEHPDVFYGIVSAYLFANIAMIVIMILSIRALAKIITVPLHILAPVILVFCVVGVVATNNRLEDAWVMFAFGLLGLVLSWAKFPLAPFVIGFVLGPLAEERLRSALMSSGGDFSEILTRPIAMTALIISAGFLIWPLYKAVMNLRKPVAGLAPDA